MYVETIEAMIDFLWGLQQMLSGSFSDPDSGDKAALPSQLVACVDPTNQGPTIARL